jgi:CRISPR/Cas system-associated endonuclease Cas1
LIPVSLRPDSRRTFKAYDGVNNVFNLAYEMLSWKVHHTLIKAKPEPYLGFLHSLAEGKPSLICDFMELYRYLIDDFVIQYCKRLQKKDEIETLINEETSLFAMYLRNEMQEWSPRIANLWQKGA